jgi:hypothetical protein
VIASTSYFPRIAAAAVSLALAGGCGADEPQKPEPTADAAPPPDQPDAQPPALSDAGNDAAPPDAEVADAEVPRPPVDCANLPAGPFPTKRVPGIRPAEDIAFDDEGFAYWNENSFIYKQRAGEKPIPITPDISIYACMRATPSGHLFAESERGLERISPEGARYLMLDGLQSLNGMEVDPLGRLYLTEFGGGRVFRFDPATSELTTLSDGVIPTPNGITFNPQFNTLYLSTWGGASVPTVYRIQLDEDGKPGETEEWVKNVGGGVNDGMAVDECGNIYMADSAGAGAIIRITPDGKSHTVVVSRPGETLHNFQWGRGKGWSEDKLYIVSLEEGLFEAELGVRSKKYW